MAVSRERLTIEDFQAFIAQPENADRLFEFINGEIVEVSPGRTSNSALEHILSFIVRLFCREHNLPCYISGGDGAYNIDGHVIAPDFAYKTTPMSNEYPDPEPPLWAVEIISPTDRAPDIRDKRQIYLHAGILYWEMYPESQSIDIYPPGEKMRTVGVNDVIDMGDVLPGFTLAVKDIFADE